MKILGTHSSRNANAQQNNRYTVEQDVVAMADNCITVKQKDMMRAPNGKYTQTTALQHTANVMIVESNEQWHNEYDKLAGWHTKTQVASGSKPNCNERVRKINQKKRKANCFENM